MRQQHENREKTTMTSPQFPCIDHSMLSPSGKVSGRARKAMEKREFERLFKGCGPLKGETRQPTARERLIMNAKMWRGLAARGMSPRKYNKLADKAEKKAGTLDND